MLSLRLGLEEVANARRQTAANLGLLLVLLLFLLFPLLLLLLRQESGLANTHGYAYVHTFSSLGASVSAAGSAGASAAGASVAAAVSLQIPSDHLMVTIG